MRSINDLLPDVRVAAAGVPQFLALYVLTRSLSEFLDRSEAWREWLPPRLMPNIEDGLTSWPNHLMSFTQQWARIKRIDNVRWTSDGKEISFATSLQLQETDPQWRTRTSAKPVHWTNEGEGAPANGSQVSSYQIRLYPAPASDVDVSLGVEARAVVVTDSVSDTGQSNFDGQIPEIPDRVFYAWRNAIVSGALATLYLIPRKDWTDQKLASYHRTEFDRAIVMAQSRANAEYGHPVMTTTYGGIP
jgi:hypothetical protein